MPGNKALKRALQTKDVARITEKIPLLTDETVFCDPDRAKEILQRNKNNRPVNWREVDRLAEIITSGQWKLHSQGIVLDKNQNLLTGQTRLWAIIRANQGIWLRMSYGNEPDVGRLIDRGRPQSARDLASRVTEQKHSPTEASIARAICALNGDLRPSKDLVAETMVKELAKLKSVMRHTTGTKKTKAVLMILAAVCVCSRNDEQAGKLAIQTERLADKLEHALLPETAERCWNKGAAFSLALERAREIVQ